MKVDICYFYRVTILLINNFSLTLVDFQQLVGHYYSFLLPRKNGRTSQSNQREVVIEPNGHPVDCVLLAGHEISCTKFDFV